MNPANKDNNILKIEGTGRPERRLLGSNLVQNIEVLTEDDDFIYRDYFSIDGHKVGSLPPVRKQKKFYQ